MVRQYDEEMAKLGGLKRMPSVDTAKQGVICLICLTNPSNVISVPCNHLALCSECFTYMKTRYNQGQVGKFECPCCRTPMDQEKFILINYKP